VTHVSLGMTYQGRVWVSVAQWSMNFDSDRTCSLCCSRHLLHIVHTTCPASHMLQLILDPKQLHSAHT